MIGGEPSPPEPEPQPHPLGADVSRARQNDYYPDEPPHQRGDPGPGGEPVDKPSEAFDLIWHGDPRTGPPREWLVEGALPKIGVALIPGQWGTYKTFVAIDLACSVVTGTPFAGRQVKREGGTLFLIAEGQEEAYVRIEAIARFKAAPIAEAQSDACTMPLDPTHLPIARVESCPQLTSDKARAEISALIRRAANEMKKRFNLPLALLVIDAMTSAAGFRDADATSEAARVMIMLAAIAREHKLLIAVIDHFGKDVTTGTRNSSAKEDNADAVLALLGERSVEGVVSNPRMAVRKVKGGATGAVTPFRVKLVDVDGAKTLILVWPSAEEAASATVKVARLWPKKLHTLKGALDEVMSAHGFMASPFLDMAPVRVVKREIVRAEYMRRYPGEASGAKQAFSDHCKAAVADGLMVKREITMTDGHKEDVLWVVNP
jgi:hypothetical protein